MKFNLKKMVALLLAAILMLSLSGLGEDAIVIEDGAAVEGEPTTIVAVIDDVDLEEQLDISDVLIIDTDAQTPAGDEMTVPESGIEDAVAPNALVKNVKIGVKEKYTIDTSSLSGKASFSSSMPSIATVTKKGVVTGKRVGTAKINIATTAGKKYTVTITVAQAPSKVTLNKTSADLEVGDTLKLKASLPAKTASNKLTWTSSNKSVATVSDNGKVTARAAGTATIIVKTFNGKKATCKLTVEDEDDDDDDDDDAGYTGDIWDAIGTDVDVFSRTIDDPLLFYSNEADYKLYMNNYMMVGASYYDNSILTIMLTSGDKNGKYTITKIHPGNDMLLCKMQAEDAGWTYWKTEGTRYWYTASFRGETIYLILTSEGSQGSNAKYVTIMRTE